NRKLYRLERMPVVAELVIDAVYRGPDASANGGYVCGRIAALAGEPVEVTLRRPPPLGVSLRVADGRLSDGEVVVAEFEPTEFELELPPAPDRKRVREGK